jgi:hypothetical protein
MKPSIRAVAVAVILLSVTSAGSAGAEPSAELGPRVQVSSPWSKDDTVGEAFRPQGDVRKIVVENGRQQVRFTFRMVAKPLWDTFATSRHTYLSYELDWRGSTAPFNRRVTVSFAEGAWHVNVYNGLGHSICTQTGGVTALANHGWRFTVPTAMCLGGAHVIRVATDFHDDQADDASDDIRLDRVPNSGGYGPFIRLPN